MIKILIHNLMLTVCYLFLMLALLLFVQGKWLCVSTAFAAAGAVMSSTYQILPDQCVTKVEQSYSLTETDLSCETENQVLSDVHVHLPGQSVCVNNVNLTGGFHYQLTAGHL